MDETLMYQRFHLCVTMCDICVCDNRTLIGHTHMPEGSE